jgi:xylulokinase
MEILLGIDVGTTSLKAGLFSPDGNCLGIEREEYQLDTPSVEKAQFDTHLYWETCVRTVKALIKRTEIDANAISALAVSSQGETLITLDDRGEPIYPAIVWLDNRADKQAKRLSRQFQPQVYQRTGIAEIIPTWTACKVLWLKENEPSIFQKTAKFLLVQDYLIYRLSGRFASDGSISCTTLYFDIAQKAWWSEMLEAIGITEDQLPGICDPGSIIGTVQENAAHELGLSMKTKIVNGGMDQAVGAIGAGNIQAGIISETTGAAMAIQVTVDRSDIDPRKSIPVYVHSVPNRFLLVPVCPTAGMAFKWFRDQFAEIEIQQAVKQHQDSFDLLTMLAASAPAGCDGLLMLPHLMGAFSPETNPNARGTFIGFTLRHTRAHFARAVMEGVAFMLKRNLEYIERAGIPIQEIICSGGGSRSRLWNQMKASVCNKPVVVLENEEAALLGDVILAGTAAKIFTSIQDGCQKMVTQQERFEVNEEKDAYLQPYENYCKLDEMLSEFFIDVYSVTKK